MKRIVLSLLTVLLIGLLGVPSLAHPESDITRNGVELKGTRTITTLHETSLLADGYVAYPHEAEADVAIFYTEFQELVGYIILRTQDDAEVEYSITLRVEPRDSVVGTSGLSLSTKLPVGKRQVILPIRVPWKPPTGEYMLVIDIHKQNRLLLGGGVGFTVR